MAAPQGPYLILYSIFLAKQTVPVQTRLRYVLQTPKYGGKACPTKMTDVRQCTNLPICQGFYWETSPWSKCILPLLKIPQCGSGLMARGNFIAFMGGNFVKICLHSGKVSILKGKNLLPRVP